MKGQLRIDSIWAFTMVDVDGTEGVISAPLGVGNTQLPLVGADLAMVKKLMPFAQMIANLKGRPVTLSHYSVRTDQMVLDPQQPKEKP